MSPTQIILGPDNIRTKQQYSEKVSASPFTRTIAFEPAPICYINPHFCHSQL